MIKPWQKAALSLIASTGLYGGFLYHLEDHTKIKNQEIAAKKVEKKVEVQQRQQLEETIATEQKSIQQLQDSLKQLNSHTQLVDSKIKDVQAQIQQIKKGIVSQQIQLAAIQPVKIQQTNPVEVTQSKSTPMTQAKPPVVQTTTKASG